MSASVCAVPANFNSYMCAAQTIAVVDTGSDRSPDIVRHLLSSASQAVEFLQIRSRVQGTVETNGNAAPEAVWPRKLFKDGLNTPQ